MNWPPPVGSPEVDWLDDDMAVDADIGSWQHHWCSLAQGVGIDGECPWCAEPIPATQRVWCSEICRTAYWENHFWMYARAAAKRRDGHRCVRCGSTQKLSVNHKIPCLGRHKKPSCRHHVEGLETLCEPCHAAETRRQKREGLI